MCCGKLPICHKELVNFLFFIYFLFFFLYKVAPVVKKTPYGTWSNSRQLARLLRLTCNARILAIKDASFQLPLPIKAMQCPFLVIAECGITLDNVKIIPLQFIFSLFLQVGTFEKTTTTTTTDYLSSSHRWGWPTNSCSKVIFKETKKKQVSCNRFWVT